MTSRERRELYTHSFCIQGLFFMTLHLGNADFTSDIIFLLIIILDLVIRHSRCNVRCTHCFVAFNARWSCSVCCLHRDVLKVSLTANRPQAMILLFIFSYQTSHSSQLRVVLYNIILHFLGVKFRQV